MTTAMIALVLAQSDELEQLDGALAPDQLTAADWVAAGVVLALSWLAGKLVSRLVQSTVGQRPDDASQQIAKLVARVVRLVIVVVGVAVALSFIGLDVGWLTVVVVVLAIMAYLISRPIVENLSAGLALSVRPAFAVGDDIVIQDFEGTVVEITQRSTVIELRDARFVHIPNTDVVDETVIVLTHSDARRTSLDVEVDERNDLAATERVILAALDDAEAVLDEPSPTVRVEGFGNASVKLSVRFWHAPELLSATSALDQAARAIHAAFAAAGVDMSTPHFVAEINSPAVEVS